MTSLLLLGLVVVEGALLGVFAIRSRRASLLRLAGDRETAREITRLQQEAGQAQTDAEAANGRKDEFLATLSHELRTPLTAIVGWAHLLQRGKLSAEETARAVGTIIRNATAQNQIIGELLDGSKVMTGKLQMGLQVVDVTGIVQAAVDTVMPAVAAKGIGIELVRGDAVAEVMGDAERLHQAFWNLLSNAIKFTPRGGEVRVRVGPCGESVEVVVTDTGLGIDPGFLPHIFERFTRDDSSSTRRSRGLGLGLSIARQLVELHGGSIAATSPGVGRGSTFTATLPRLLRTLAADQFQIDLTPPVPPSERASVVASLAARRDA